MITNLLKCDDGYALVIDQTLLDRINATEKTAFELFSDGVSLVLVPVRLGNDDQTSPNTLDMVQQQYGKGMKKLAE